MKKEPTTRRITTALPESLFAKIVSIAERDKCTRSSVVYRLVAQALERKPQTKRNRR